MTTVDWIAAAVIAVAALNGLRKGLIAGALSLAGIAAGAYVGARIAPQLLSGTTSAYTPLVSLGGAVVAGVLLQSIGSMVGGMVGKTLFVLPPLKALDTIGGAALGAATGAALVWVLGAVALHVPGQTELRRQVQQSLILKRLNEEVPPERIMDALARVDPFPALRGPDAPVEPPDPLLLRQPAVKLAKQSVVRVTGSACGLGIVGSGWIAAPGLVVTNAHVVAGVKGPRVDRGEDSDRRTATVVLFDPRNDIAILRVSGIGGRALALADPRSGVAVAILGFPENGPFTATPGRVGQTATVLTDDAYGRGPVGRRITTIRGHVRHGNSGGPAVDAGGNVQTTVFASRVGSRAGYGVATDVVRKAIAKARSAKAVSSGPCVR